MLSSQKINQAPSLQSKLFNRIRQQLPTHLSMVDEVAEVLGISTDSAYRRLRGETALTLDEAGRLAGYFHIPIYDLFEPSDESVLFKRVVVNAKSRGFEDYLQDTKAYFDAIDSAREKRGIYAAKDIPVFYYFLFPDLARFKLFFWLKTVKEVEALKNQAFSMRNVPDKYMTLGTAIAQTYLRIPFIEIWNDETTVSTLRQIEYYYEAGLLEHQSDALLLLDQVEALIQHIQQQAKTGVKLYEGRELGSYELYFNEILLLDNTILTQADGVLSSLFSYNAMDYLHTTDAGFCSEVQDWLRVQMEKSALISRVSEKERNRFFKKIYSRIEESRQKVR